MIGLGSNRLTVCRRGGMSVTQAGKGGMEWLAGYRDPIWASPYSAAATAALKAQFPTQWPTIRDYGFAHPEIVDGINTYAPIDPLVMYSLISELGKVRYAGGTGSFAREDYLHNVFALGVFKFEADLKLTGRGNTWECVLMLDGTDGTSINGPYYWQIQFVDRIVMPAGNTNISIPTGSRMPYMLEQADNNIQRAKIGTSEWTKTGSVSADNYALEIGAAHIPMQVYGARFTTPSNDYQFVPFKNRDNTVKLVDIRNSGMELVVRTGSFTISESPS